MQVKFGYRIPPMIKKLFTQATYLITLGFFVLAIHQLWHRDWTGLFLMTQALITSFLPYILRRYFDIYTPFVLRISIVVFMLLTLVLGEMANFYTTYWWWDLILHGVASMGITLIMFIFLLIFFKYIELKQVAPFATFLAVGTSLAFAVLWEMYEFLIDIYTQSDSPMQPSNFDTMTDLAVAVVGAVLVGVFGYRYIKWNTHDVVSRVIQVGAERNS